MITAIAAWILGTETRTIELIPTDDLWIYPHASEPDKDPYLRVWGTEDGAVAEKGDSHEAFSYSYLKFDLRSVEAKGTIVGATLVLTHIKDPAYTVELSKGSPVEIRRLGTDFSEAKWTYEDVNRLAPDRDPKTIFGSKSMADEPTKGQDWVMEIDLLKGPAKFQEAWDNALAKKQPFAFAMTSSLDPSAGGQRAVYKFFSKDNPDATKRPKLRIEFKKD